MTKRFKFGWGKTLVFEVIVPIMVIITVIGLITHELLSAL